MQRGQNSPTIVRDMTLNCIWQWGSIPSALGNVEYLFIAITSGPLRPGVVVPDRVPSVGQIELFDNFNSVQTNEWC